MLKSLLFIFQCILYRTTTFSMFEQLTCLQNISQHLSFTKLRPGGKKGTSSQVTTQSDMQVYTNTVQIFHHIC